MTKAALRKKYLEMRMQLGTEEKKNAETNMLKRFQVLDFPSIKILMSYLPIQKKNEIDVSSLSDFLKSKYPDLVLAFPVANTVSATMSAFEVNAETIFSINEWGIKEPDIKLPIKAESIDLIFVPLLCFDRKGFRVGYGKGFYDKFLSNCRPNVIKIGFSYFPPVNGIDDLDQWDYPLDYIISPDQAYAFQ